MPAFCRARTHPRHPQGPPNLGRRTENGGRLCENSHLLKSTKDIARKMPKKYILFAYGSLLNPDSASRALRREVRPEDYQPHDQTGYRRHWNAGERVFSTTLQQEITAIFLNLEPAADGIVTGADLCVSESEFLLLQQREKNYRMVSLGIDAKGGLERFTFIARETAISRPDDTDTWLPVAYIDLVAHGCLRFGRLFSLRFAQTTADIEFPLLSGEYRFVDPLQGKLV